MNTEIMTWTGIAFCITQSAIFSGLNLAFFSLSRLQLEVDAEEDMRAKKVLALRKDSNFLLTTILWGNVGINVLLTLLSNSVMAGVIAFVFSTFVITLFGEILPQAYFSRHSLKIASLLSPIIRIYQFILYPVAKPSARLLDAWLGKEGITYLREENLKAMIHKHIEAKDAEVETLEGIGALNFLDIDDLGVLDEGEVIDVKSIIPLPTKVDFPLIPEFSSDPNDPFLKRIDASGHTWVILTDEKSNLPQYVMDADGFLRAVMFSKRSADPYLYCHRPILIKDSMTSLGEAIHELKVSESSDEDHDGVIENDVILIWGDDEKRIITGADILGRLLKGVASPSDDPPEQENESPEQENELSDTTDSTIPK